MFGVNSRNRQLARPRRRWEDNIEMDFQEIGYCGRGLDWLRIGTGGWLVCARR